MTPEFETKGVETTRYVYTFPEFLLPSECKHIVDKVKDVPFTHHPTHSIYTCREKKLSSILSNRLQRTLPRKIFDPITKELWEYVRLDEEWSHYQFNKDQNTSADYDRTYKGLLGHQAKFMLEIYLQDDIYRGLTRLYTRGSLESFLDIRPKTGKAVVYSLHFLKAEDQLLAGVKHIVCCPVWYHKVSF